MGSRFQVKMEYPFLANTNAQLCFMWNQAADQMPSEEGEEEEISRCLGEGRALVHNQLNRVLFATDKIWFDSDDATLIKES